MRSLKTSIIGVFVLLFLVATVTSRVAVSQKSKPPTGQANVASTDEELVKCPIQQETPPCNTPICIAPALEEAPTAFDDTTNDFVDQTQHNKDRETFEVRDFIKDGLGPVYNAQACSECHQNPISGSVSQINELRAGHQDVFGNFVDAPGGSLINDRAIDPKIQERVPPIFSAMIKEEEPVRTFRTSLNLLGDGFVEAVPNETLLKIAADQPNDVVSGHLVHGQAIPVPIEELPPDSRRICRIGRFGHKDQHASLLSFSGDAYLNEMGITNRLFLMENTSLGRSTAAFDPIPNDSTLPCDPTTNPPPGQNTFCGEDPERDIDAFTQFMRATKAPARDADVAHTDEAVKGEELFHAIGCAVCHVDTMVTAQKGVVINGGTFKVPGALANKIFHPYGDFLLHDIGTGDGIVQNGGQKTRTKVRTAPLWGLRVHTRLMHDGASLTFFDAIKRHDVEAKVVADNFFNLSPADQINIIIFLESL
ncbi:MAG TPA: di-heme oxidoredictase family protein [Pyrinomonadaceae bacterium]|jgi:hypothetical protein|nr:di-heme oxidoredictase family protein [Pyrinomonadaceae bacterium]